METPTAATSALKGNITNNEQLLNAIKTKFAKQNTNETMSNNPIKLTIPVLNIQTNNDNKLTHNSNNATSNKLNDFLLGQLSEKRLNGELPTTTNNGFVLPKLQFKLEQKSSATGFIVPTIFNSKSENLTIPTINSINNALSDLKVNGDDAPKTQESHSAAAIDLTTALSATNSTNQIICKANNQKPIEVFNIPFIDCDMPHSSNFKMFAIPNTNEYCQTDISYTKFKHYLVDPSAFGRVFGLNYKPKVMRRKASLIKNLKAKHKITPFLFNTQSPDDKVMAAMNKYQRQN